MGMCINRVEYTPEVTNRFWRKVRFRESCWLWERPNADGYGRFHFRGKPTLAHRWSYQQLVGPIPEGLTLDHLCRKRACVRPEHLELVSLAENKRRGESPAALNTRKSFCPQGHPYDLFNTISRRGKRECRECANARARLYRTLPGQRERHTAYIREWRKMKTRT